MRACAPARYFWIATQMPNFEKNCEVIGHDVIETNEYKNRQPPCCVRRDMRSNTPVSRSALHLTVRQRRDANCIAVASPRDFLCEPAPNDVAGKALPYCIDFAQRRALYVLGVDPQSVQEAPFYYLYLRRHAQRLLSVPYEFGPLAGDEPARDPVFLFSPGRCGSALLSRVLAEAGIPSVSEPDFYTQVATSIWASPLNLRRDRLLKTMWAMSDDLAAVLGGVPVIKLRAECARSPDMFVRRPGARTLIMFRGFEDWARSTARGFGTGPAKAVSTYRTALECYARLSRISACHVMRYEDWVNDPITAAEDLARFLAVTIPSGAARKAVVAPSQKEAPQAGRARPGWETNFDVAMRLWHAPRLVSAREKLEIPDVWG